MYGWDNMNYLLAHIISNFFAVIILFFCWNYQRIGRILMFLLFGWAGVINWLTALHTPQDYLSYADFTFVTFYKDFIRGWFSQNVLMAVGFIATSQLLIAVTMWFKGWLFKLGTIGGMIFLVSIIPLGVGSGFPFPIIAAIAFYKLFTTIDIDVLWKPVHFYNNKKLST
jgi:hypothetical protein